jgi:hypothetical protein
MEILGTFFLTKKKRGSLPLKEYRIIYRKFYLAMKKLLPIMTVPAVLHFANRKWNRITLKRCQGLRQVLTLITAIFFPMLRKNAFHIWKNIFFRRFLKTSGLKAAKY